MLYGIYLLVESDTDNGWNGILGEMPPPYLLEITLVTYEDVDPDLLRKELADHLFRTQLQDPEDRTKKTTRADLAHRHNIRVIESAIEAKTIAAVTLLELKSRVRYSFVDHLSNSSMAVNS